MSGICVNCFNSKVQNGGGNMPVPCALCCADDYKYMQEVIRKQAHIPPIPVQATTAKEHIECIFHKTEEIVKKKISWFKRLWYFITFRKNKLER